MAKLRRNPKPLTLPVHDHRKKYDIVHVSWEDASIKVGWHEEETAIIEAETPALIQTFGMKIYECRQYILVSQSGHSGTTDCSFRIPRSLIRKMRKLGSVTA